MMNQWVTGVLQTGTESVDAACLPRVSVATCPHSNGRGMLRSARAGPGNDERRATCHGARLFVVPQRLRQSRAFPSSV